MTRSEFPRLAAALALLAAAGCSGGHGPRAGGTAAGQAPPAGFTADTATPAGLLGGATASEAGCRALPDALWVVAKGRGECLRYTEAGAAYGAARPTAIVHIPGDVAGLAYRFAGGRPQAELTGGGRPMPPETARSLAQSLSAAGDDRPVILLARPGMGGSSGDHAADRHTEAEVALIDAALDSLRRRYGFRDFVLSGFSSGGAVAANLLARRSDIRCAVLASAPLDLAAFYRGPDGALPDGYAMRSATLADPMRSVGALRPDAAILVLGDRHDRKVPPAAWEAWAEAARRAGLPVVSAEVSGFDPAEPAGARSHHQTEAAALEAALACAARAGG